MNDRISLDTLVENAALELVNRHSLDEIEAILTSIGVTRLASSRA
jgi:hypothetical protein